MGLAEFGRLDKWDFLKTLHCTVWEVEKLVSIFDG